MFYLTHYIYHGTDPYRTALCYGTMTKVKYKEGVCMDLSLANNCMVLELETEEKPCKGAPVYDALAEIMEGEGRSIEDVGWFNEADGTYVTKHDPHGDWAHCNWLGYAEGYGIEYFATREEAEAYIAAEDGPTPSEGSYVEEIENC